MSIIESFKLFNEQHKEQFGTSDCLLKHLDETCPEWKDLIKDPNCWKEIFEFEVQFLRNGWRKEFADALFEAIGNPKVEQMIFDNNNVDPWYYYAAAQRLLKMNPDGFLEKYVNVVKRASFKLDGCAYGHLKDIFNFPGAVEVAIDMCNNDETREYALDFLQQVLVENWELYPDDIKEKIMIRSDNVVREQCTQQIWDSLSDMHKFTLVHRIVVNEYNYVHDVMVLYEYLTTDEGCKLPIITLDIRYTLDEIRHHQDLFSNRDEAYILEYIRHHIFGHFDHPTIDYEQIRYTPSEQLNRFLQFAENAGDTILAKELQLAKREIEHSFFDVEHRRY